MLYSQVNFSLELLLAEMRANKSSSTAVNPISTAVFSGYDNFINCDQAAAGNKTINCILHKKTIVILFENIMKLLIISKRSI